MPAKILHSVFGYTQFKPLQREVIENVLARRDSLVIMPTGGGKSLCYQIPALLFPGLTVVVSPLIALMKDQVEQLQALGVAALFLNSSLTPEEYHANEEQVRRGKVKLLYVAPETLLTPRLFNLLDNVTVDCLTIDEAHCISEWGHDFRPEYRQLVSVRKRYPKAVCLALTATATARVRQDIKASLGFQDSNEFVASFNRPNLMIEVLPKTDPAAQVLEFLRRFDGQSGIIYCFSRKQVDELSAFLSGRGYSVRPYHAGLEDGIRKQNQELFIRDDVQIIVATIAFGMGINKPNVRFVVHFDLPKSIEGYYQEIGRAGRDGLTAHCLMLYSYADVSKLRYFIDQKEETERRVAYEHLSALTRYAESYECRRKPLLAYFGEQYTGENCGMCDNCLEEAGGKTEITIPAQKFLSCVKRTGERFAATHIVHVLLGDANEKVLKYGHQDLSTFGIGKDLTRRQWLHIAHQLVQQGLLDQSPDFFRTLRLTSEAVEALRSRAPIYGTLLTDVPARKARKKAGEPDYDGELFALLRQKRKELAEDAHVPPYVIFSDRTLVEMAAYYPTNPAALKRINGVGQVKLERYGDEFMNVIQDFCKKNNIKPNPNHNTGQTKPARTQMGKPRYVEAAEAYNSGKSVMDVAAQFQVQPNTVLEYLVKYTMEGNTLRSGDDLLIPSVVTPAQQAAALQAFAEFGPVYLKPVFDRLEGAVSYDDLKLLRLKYLVENTTPSS